MRRQIIAVVLALVAARAACAQESQAGMKGYELYSWKSRGKWHYSLLAGTNRSKTYDEITSGKTVLVGDTALERELKKLGRGHEVFWHADAPSSVEMPRAAERPNFQMPSRKRIKRIRAYCARHGIRLRLV